MCPESEKGVPDLGIKFQFDSNINLFEPAGDTIIVHELYALGDQAILNRIGHLHIDNLDKLSRRRDLKGITLRLVEPEISQVLPCSNLECSP